MRGIKIRHNDDVILFKKIPHFYMTSQMDARIITK
jgi:hypothetical protein